VTRHLHTIDGSGFEFLTLFFRNLNFSRRRVSESKDLAVATS